MKRQPAFCLFLFLAVLVSATFSTATAVGKRPTLTVVNWSWYVEVDETLDEELPIVQRSPVLQQFEKEFACHLMYVELDDEYSIRDFLLDDPGNVDVVNLSTGFINELSEQGVLLQLDPTLIPHLEHVSPGIKNLVPAEVFPFQCPYFAGQTGILYNRQAVGGELTSWAEFWNPNANFLVGALGGSESVLGSFLMMEGSPISSNDSEALRRVGRQFLQQVQIGRVGYLSDDLESLATMVASGELGAIFMYTGDALGFIDEDYSGNLAYVLPEDGFEVILDSWAVSVATKNKALAHSFLDFMLRPEIQVRQSLALYTQVVTEEAHALLAKEEPDHQYLEYLMGPGVTGNKGQLIHRQSTVEIDALWRRIIGSSAK